MKKSKKIIGIVLSLILIFSITATMFIATANTKETSIIITVDKTELSAGQSATVSVKVTSNYPIATMSIPVFYDKTLVDVSDATAILTDYAVKSAITESQSADTSKIYANTGINSDKFGFVLATYIGGAGTTVPETMDSVVLTFKITAKADAAGTEVIKCITQSAKTDENVAGMLYFGSPVSGNTITSVPENVENIDLTQAQANVTISSDGVALFANKETTAFVDNVNKYIYGVPAGISVEDLTEYFLVSNGTFEMVANEGGYTNGTGATLVVKDANNNEVDYYTLVIFGDVNGDGLTDSTDTGLIMSSVALLSELSTLQSYAGDVNGDGLTDSTDTGLIMSSVAMVSELSVNPYEK